MLFSLKKRISNEGESLMGITKKVKASLNIGQSSALGAKDQLNKYMLSQFFIQLVNLSQLIKAMKAFVGHKKMLTSSVLFEGLNLCLNKAMSDMVHDRYDEQGQITLIKACSEELGIQVHDIKIKSLYPRLLKLTLMISKPHTTLLNGELKSRLEALFGESLKINMGKVRHKYLKIDITSVRNFKIEHGVSYVGKSGRKVSGDSYLCENFQNGTTMLAISDGMGNGKLAHEESSLALKVLKCMLNFDVPVVDAVRVLADLKQQSNLEERFFSLDLCLINKETSRGYFYKQAATTTFLLRGESMQRIEKSGLPIGVVDAEGIDCIVTDLEADDLIVMCSDGIVDSFSDINVFENQMIKHKDESVKKISQDLLDYTVRRNRGIIHDDMMVVVAKYQSTRS